MSFQIDPTLVLASRLCLPIECRLPALPNQGRLSTGCRLYATAHNVKTGRLIGAAYGCPMRSRGEWFADRCANYPSVRYSTEWMAHCAQTERINVTGKTTVKKTAQVQPEIIAELRVDPEGAKALTKVLVQSEHVNELVKESADELSSINSVIKQEIANQEPHQESHQESPPAVEIVLEKSEAVESKVQEASDKLTVVNQALESEIKERIIIDHKLAVAIEQKEVAHDAALHDALTGLPNRALFADRLEHAIAQTNRHGGKLAVMFVDLDKFKTVNDTYGHDAGDIVLQSAAQRLTENFRDEDTVSRHGGDEFLCLLTEIKDESNIAMIAGKITKAMQAPFTLAVDGLEIRATIGASIGISIFPQHGTTAETLIKTADAAMYRAKKTQSGHSFAE